MKTPTEITREEASKLLQEAANGPRQQVTIAYGGKWYDIRGMNPEEIHAFTEELLGRTIKPEEVASIDLQVKEGGKKE